LLISELLSESLSSNEEKAKSQSLTDLQLDNFFSEMCKVNERDFLICWMMWQLKCTIHQVLNFRVGDYNSILGVFKINDNDLRFCELIPKLKELILKQCEEKEKNELIFSTETGRSIHPGQIVRNMKIASKRAKLPITLSPKTLYAYTIAYSKIAFSLISEEERNKLYEKSGKTPSPYEKMKFCI
jgi:hypothetical protein